MKRHLFSRDLMVLYKNFGEIKKNVRKRHKRDINRKRRKRFMSVVLKDEDR